MTLPTARGRAALRRLALPAAAILIAAALAACRPAAPAPKPPAPAVPAADSGRVTDSETRKKEITMDPKGNLMVIADGRTDYTLAVSPDVQAGNAADVAYLRRVLTDRFGVCPPDDDASDGAAGQRLSLSYCGTIHALDWSVTVDPETGLVALSAGGRTAMARAIRAFAATYCATDSRTLAVNVDGIGYDYARDRIDNSPLLSYQGGEQTVLAPSDAEGKLMTPAWLDTAVMAEVRIDAASIGGTFRASYDLIDFYAEAGVNVLWLAPIYERGGGNGYGNVGLHRVEPLLTGTEDQAAGWREVQAFVDYAHSKGVYILLDIISWGVVESSELVEFHPDWFSGQAWGNPAFDWTNEEFREWFISRAVENIERTGADGYRCDCEPFTAGYEVYAEIRRRLNEEGLYPVIMSEEGGFRKDAFDCEQDGVLDYSSMSRGELYQRPVNFFTDGYLDIVESTKTGKGLGASSLQDPRRRGGCRYYTNCITNHDYQRRAVGGNRLRIGYAALYAPYIPIWYMGDEFGTTLRGAVLYDVSVNYGAIGRDWDRTLFLEDVKQMVRIRRTYPDLFEYWPIDHRETNICRVTAEGLTGLTGYARFRDNRMILIVPNGEEDNDGFCRIRVPFEEGFSGTDGAFRVTDLLTGRTVAEGTAAETDGFPAIVPPQHCGVFLVERNP